MASSDTEYRKRPIASPNGVYLAAVALRHARDENVEVITNLFFDAVADRCTSINTATFRTMLQAFNNLAAFIVAIDRRDKGMVERLAPALLECVERMYSLEMASYPVEQPAQPDIEQALAAIVNANNVEQTSYDPMGEGDGDNTSR